MCVKGRPWECACPRSPGGARWGHGSVAQAAALLTSLLPSRHPVWFYFGVVGSFLFILIQLVLFIDFAHSWNQRWLGKAEERDSRAWYAGQCRPTGWPPCGAG